MSAYDILDDLRPTYPKIAPPTIYNALAALTKQGRVHRVESLKAYIACQCDHDKRGSILSICDGCGKVEERAAPELREKLSGILEQDGFDSQRHVIEVHVACRPCSPSEARGCPAAS